MRHIRAVLLIILCCMLCACERRDAEPKNQDADSGWAVDDSVQGSWSIADKNALTDNIDARYTAGGQDRFVYLSSSEADFTINTVTKIESGSVYISKKPLKCPRQEQGNYRLWKLYGGGDLQEGFLALWDVNDGTERNYLEFVKYDLNGTVLNSVTSDEAGVWFDKTEIVDICEKEGCYYVLTDIGLTVFNKEGVIKDTKLDAGQRQLIETGESVYLIENGVNESLAFIVQDGNVSRNAILLPICGDRFLAGEDGLIYAISAGKLYSVDVAGRKVKLIINWNDVCGELTADTLKYIIGCDGQAITAVCYYRGSYVLLKLEWTDKTDERKVITLLTANEYGWLAQRAGEFNGMNNEYRIVVKKISEGDDTEEDRQTKIRLMLSSGECPDIIDIGCIVGWEELADKGIFEDLNPYMENSSIVDVNDYLPQLLEGGRLGNRQIFIPYDFLLLMLYGKEENIGNNQIWTLEEMLGLYELHEDMSILNCEPRNCLKYLMTISLDEFVDFDSMECNFSTELFYRLLSAAAQARYTQPESGRAIEAVVKDYSLMDTAYLYSIEAYLGYGGTILPYGKDGAEYQLALKGYPSKDGQAKAEIQLCSGAKAAISAKSRNKEGAWQFIEYIQSYKSDFYAGFPARESWFLERTQKLIQGSFDMAKELECSQEDVDNLLEIIADARYGTSREAEIVDIVLEEAQAYFAENRTAQEAAAVIQDRVQLYLEELK